MGEYYLECGPEETKPELKEVLKFIENPIFTSSIINGAHIKYFLSIALLLGSIITGNLATSNKMKFEWWVKFLWGLVSIIFIILFVLIITGILDRKTVSKTKK